MQKPNQFKHKFISSIFWNSLDSIIAQVLITAHHVMLKAFTGAEFHGIFASYSSIIYTFIPLFNLGFDYSLSAHLKDFIQTRKSFISLLLFQFLPQLFLTGLIAHLISQPFFYNLFFTTSVTPEIAFWLKSTFLLEYARKSLRSFLQLMFYTHITALVEIFGTLFYMATFWALAWLLHINPTMLLAFQLLALSAIIQIITLLVSSIKVFWTFSSEAEKTSSNLYSAHKGITQTRIGIWANHITSQINYSNFMIPFSNSCFGPTQASLLSILLNSARCIKLFFQKGLGISSLALIAHPFDQQSTPKDVKYSYPLYYLYNLSLPLLIFFLINSSKLSYLIGDNQVVWHLTSIACFLSIIEGAISVYEKFYIAEKKIYLFSIINSAGSAILFATAYYFLIFNNLSQFFLFFFLIRVIALTLIIYLSHYIFKLSPTPFINAYILAAATLFSVIFYLLF